MLLINYSGYLGIFITLFAVLYSYKMIRTKDDFVEVYDKSTGIKFYLDKEKMNNREEAMK